MVRGKADESYQLLPSIIHRIKVTNLGSTAELDTDESNRFKHMFIALAASIQGWKHCRHVIVVDGTFLKAAHGGTLLTACTKDGNDNIFPLAFGITDSENNNSWEWFFLKLKDIYGERDGLCFISD